MSIQRLLIRLSKMIAYVLERNPYEFGLSPDENGYVKIKELLKAITEEDGWGHIKRSNLDELLFSMSPSPIEISGDLIRAVHHDRLKKPVYAENLPKQIYTCIRKKAHIHVTKKGIAPHDNNYVILSSDKQNAEKSGKRRDQNFILLTVNTSLAEDRGVFFFSAGSSVYLAKHIPPDCFTGPPLPAPEKKSSKKTVKKNSDKKTELTPGSYFPDIMISSEKGKKKRGKQEKNSWKENKKKLRRQKEKIRSEF